MINDDRKQAIVNLLSDPSFDPSQYIEDLLIEGVNSHLGKIIAAEPKYCKHFVNIHIDSIGSSEIAILTKFNDWLNDKDTFTRVLKILDNYAGSYCLTDYIKKCPKEHYDFIANNIGFNSPGFNRSDFDFNDNFKGLIFNTNQLNTIALNHRVDNVAYRFNGSTWLADNISSVDSAVALSHSNAIYTCAIIAERMPIKLLHLVRDELRKFSRLKCYNEGCGFESKTLSGISNHRNKCDKRDKVIWHPADIMKARTAGTYQHRAAFNAAINYEPTPFS